MITIFFNFLHFLRNQATVDVFISAAPTGHSTFTHSSDVYAFLSVFVSAGLASCLAEVVHPSPTGRGSAAYRARVGGLCTYLSWRVRTEFLTITVPSARGCSLE